MNFRDAFFHHRRGYRALSFVLVGALAVGTYVVVNRMPDSSVPGWVLKDRRAAVQTALRGQEVLKQARARLNLPINKGDRFQTGVIGVASSQITTELGSLDSHRTAANPVFAAAVVQMLYKAGVRPGDLVGVGMTGSYPGFDLDAYAGVEAIGATPVAISSVSSSAYGANEPRFTWPAMEKALYDAGVIHHRSIAVAAGGSLSGKDYAARRREVTRSGLKEIPVLTTSEEIKLREHMYVLAANKAGKQVKAFVNVGGSSANVGSSAAEAIIKPGLSRPHWSSFQASRLGVVGFMGQQGIPIVALMNVSKLAKQFGVPWDPHLQPNARDIAPPPPNPIAVAAALLLIVAVVVAMHRKGLFRVPTWELPPGLERGTRTPGAPGANLREEGAEGSTVDSRRVPVAGPDPIKTSN